MRKRLLSITAGVIAALTLTIPAYALPAEAVPSGTTSLTSRDFPGMESPNPGPFPIQATEKDLEEFEASGNEETASTPESPDDSEVSEPSDSSSNTENEGPETLEPSEPLEPGGEPVGPDNSEAGGNPDNPESPAPDTSKDPETPIEPENPEPPAISDETLSADVSAIRESLGVYIENQRPFFADDIEKQYFFDNLAAIRRDLDILVYAVIPVAAAVFLIWKFCLWFYRTFVESALE